MLGEAPEKREHVHRFFRAPFSVVFLLRPSKVTRVLSQKRFPSSSRSLHLEIQEAEAELSFYSPPSLFSLVE